MESALWRNAGTSAGQSVENWQIIVYMSYAAVFSIKLQTFWMPVVRLGQTDKQRDKTNSREIQIHLSINVSIVFHEALDGLLKTPGSRQV